MVIGVEEQFIFVAGLNQAVQKFLALAIGIIVLVILCAGILL